MWLLSLGCAVSCRLCWCGSKLHSSLSTPFLSFFSFLLYVDKSFSDHFLILLVLLFVIHAEVCTTLSWSCVEQNNMVENIHYLFSYDDVHTFAGTSSSNCICFSWPRWCIMLYTESHVISHSVYLNCQYIMQYLPLCRLGAILPPSLVSSLTFSFSFTLPPSIYLVHLVVFLVLPRHPLWWTMTCVSSLSLHKTSRCHFKSQKLGLLAVPTPCIQL